MAVRQSVLFAMALVAIGCFGGDPVPKDGDPPPVKNGKDGGAPAYAEFHDAGRSILQLRDMAAAKGIPFRKEGWYNTEPFAAEEEKPCHRKMRVVEKGFLKTLDEQQKLLRAGEEVPRARAVVVGLLEGKLPFTNHYVRCRKEGAYEVFVGNFLTEGGISIHIAWWEDGRERYPDTTLVAELVAAK